MKYALAYCWIGPLCIATAISALGQEKTEGIAGIRPVNPAAPKQLVYKLRIHPAPAPRPALQYRLLPELRDMQSGNAVIRYYRAFSPDWLNYHRKDLQMAIRKWRDDPLKPPPEILRMRGGPLQEIDEGARRTFCDWDMLRSLRKEGVGILLPDIAAFRVYAHLLAARTRFQINERKFGDAAYGLQSGFAFSRHMGDGSTLITALVAIALADEMTEEVHQWIQQKDSPNLYWALTHLPSPFIDMRKPMDGERIMLDQLFPGVREMVHPARARPMSKLELEELLHKVFQARGLIGGKQSPGRFMERVLLAVQATAVYPQAKAYLLEQGIPAKTVNQMPVTQAAMLYEIHSNDVYFDEMAKWFGRPYLQMKSGVERAQRELQKARLNPSSTGMHIVAMFLPATDKAFTASYRLDRKLASLRCVEAIRMHAAATGSLPGKLSEIKVAPPPIDPITGKLFDYRLTGKTATVTAPPPPGQTVSDARINRMTWTYELTLLP